MHRIGHPSILGIDRLSGSLQPSVARDGQRRSSAEFPRSSSVDGVVPATTALCVNGTWPQAPAVSRSLSKARLTFATASAR